MQLNIGLSSAYDVIKDTYDYETCKEIVEHGCVSGVAHDHIYYKDTLSFFDKYEDEMIEYITDVLGDEVMDSLWVQNTGNITGYKNDVTWSFIELVAMSVVDSDEIYAIQA
tara:strand:+ start:3977 stop:4309 length:333 start_codon:yes stop_codon:yes gene_type:complete